MTPREEIDRALTQLSVSGELQIAERAVNALLVGLEEGVHTKMFRLLGAEEEVAPEVALNAWVELHAYYRLRQRLTQALKMGQSASTTLEPIWKEGM